MGLSRLMPIANPYPGLVVTWDKRNYTLICQSEDDGWILAATKEVDQRKGRLNPPYWEHGDSVIHLSPKRFRNEVTP